MRKILSLPILSSYLPVSPQETGKIDQVPFLFQQAESEANYDKYFRPMTRCGVFSGTDPSENRQNDDGQNFQNLMLTLKNPQLSTLEA